MHQLYILCNCLYFCLLTIYISFASLQYSPLQYSFGTIFFYIIFSSLVFQQPFWIFVFFLNFLKSCDYLSYSNLGLLINSSFGIRHGIHQPCNHINLLKLTNYIKAKCLYEVIFFWYSIGYLNHSVHSPISAGELSLLPNFQKGGLDRISIFSGGCWERARWLFQGVPVFR